MTSGKITPPPPEWLTLPEVLEFLDSQGIEANDGAQALERAFHDSQIRTRGRSKEWHGHDTKTDLLAVAWDEGAVDWQCSALKKRGRWGDYEITEVDVSRIGLIRWLGTAGPDDGIATERGEPTKETWTRPLASGETSCRDWLIKKMEGGAPKSKSKGDYKSEALNQFRGLSKRGFDRAWDKAIDATGNTTWKDPGAPKKSSQ